MSSLGAGAVALLAAAPVNGAAQTAAETGAGQGNIHDKPVSAICADLCAGSRTSLSLQ